MIMELPQLVDTIECSCEGCVSACHKKPGWFIPEEIKPAADSMGLSEKEFFDKYLAVDYYFSSTEKLFVLAPVTKRSKPGVEYPLDPRGSCIFITDDNKCSIHAFKPYECKHYDHLKNHDTLKECHHAIAETWSPHKDKIVELLGREPTVEPSPIEILEFMMSSMS